MVASKSQLGVLSKPHGVCGMVFDTGVSRFFLVVVSNSELYLSSVLARGVWCGQLTIDDSVMEYLGTSICTFYVLLLLEAWLGEVDCLMTSRIGYSVLSSLP